MVSRKDISGTFAHLLALDVAMSGSDPPPAGPPARQTGDALHPRRLRLDRSVRPDRRGREPLPAGKLVIDGELISADERAGGLRRPAGRPEERSPRPLRALHVRPHAPRRLRHARGAAGRSQAPAGVAPGQRQARRLRASSTASTFEDGADLYARGSALGIVTHVNPLMLRER
jgi:hypothetical protein